jgi:hypothetical protein
MQARLATSATRALDVLDELLDHPDEATRLRAVNTALTHPLRYQLAQPAEPDTEPAPEADNPIAMGALRTHTSERAWDADTVPAPEDVAEGDDGE